MKVSHVLYKVNNLENSFSNFKKKGFNIEYGSKRNPHNAIIYFSEGPYIELLEKAPISSFAKTLLKIIGKRKVVDRFHIWENANEGFFEICLENHTTNFIEEEAIFKRFGLDYFITKSKRLDPLERLLKWKLLFPNNLQIPFLMTPFNINPKPKNYIHPNGIIRIKHILYTINSEFIPILNRLCNDSILSVSIGKGGVKEVFYEKKKK